MDHRHPTMAEYYTVVLGYSVVVLICIAFFIYFLFVGLKSKDARVVDAKPSKQ